MKLALAAALALSLLAGCGSDDDGETAADTASRTQDTGADGSAVFRSGAVGFTFEYPAEFRAEEQAQKARPGVAAVLAQVSVADPDRFNAVKVRQSADQAFKPSRYVREFKRAFAADAEGGVEVRREEIGALSTTVIEFDDSAPGERPVRFRSTSYFFAGAGATWQVECISEEEHRDDVERACRQVLESAEFRAR